MMRAALLRMSWLALAAGLFAACETDSNPAGAPLHDVTADASAEADGVEVFVDAVADVPPDVPWVDVGSTPDVPPEWTDVPADVPPEAADVALELPPEPTDVPLDLSPEWTDVPADLPAEVAGVQCGGENPSFPSFSKACAAHDDCAIGLHQVDCCGNRVALGLDASQVAAFAEAEAACDAQYPKCGCPQGPVVADDGQSAFDPAQIQVQCVEGECRTFVPPCALVEPFQWQNACAVDGDCALALHQVNCCGTFHAWGVTADVLPAFAEAETACEASYPLCGCASQPTLAQDGNTGSSLEDLAVACQQGACHSYVVGATPRCHDGNDCPNGEMCLSPGQSMPCGMCFEPENTCASDPDCPEGAVCELVSGGCTCYAATQCVPACNAPASLACEVGFTCAASGHCVPTPCTADADCPELFACGAGEGTCARKACTADDQCGWGRCVQGLCYGELGSCIFPPP